VRRIDINILSQIKQIEPLTARREYELAVKYEELGDHDAADELLVSHLPLVIAVAFRYRHYRLPMEDLVQEGAIGLMKALMRFDPHKGHRFASFAEWWVKAYIRTFIIKTWSLVKLGTTQAQRKLFFRIGDIGEHSDQKSRDKRIEELARKLQVKTRDVIEVEARVRARERHLDEEQSARKGFGAIGPSNDLSLDQEELLIRKESEIALSDLTEIALRKLDRRERFIITKRFMDDTPWTLRQLGDRFGITRERVRQVQQRALCKLKKELCGISSTHSATFLIPLCS
jgi:RNA polymerase sigma-32 factor